MSGARIEENADGSAVVKFAKPIKLDGEEHDRATIPALKGKHLRGSPVLNTMGQFVELAARMVLPLGIVDEMEPQDAVAVADFLLGKLKPSPSTGSEPSEK